MRFNEHNHYHLQCEIDNVISYIYRTKVYLKDQMSSNKHIQYPYHYIVMYVYMYISIQLYEYIHTL